MLKGEGEPGMVKLLEALAGDRGAIPKVPGAVTADGEGPRPGFVEHLDEIAPARDLVRKRRKYFIGVLDPCASIEFSRGCPRTARSAAPGRSTAAAIGCAARSEWSRISPPSPSRALSSSTTSRSSRKHGFAIGEAIARKGIRKQFYLETRGDVLLRNKEVFQFWKKIGLTYIFLGIEAIDEEGLRKFRKRIPLGRNFEALEFARSLGVDVAINIIADPDWDEDRFRVVRDWCMNVPEVVNISVNTPYPGTETWVTEERRLQTRDYRLFDIQHAVLPTRPLPLAAFYRELLHTQRVLYSKHMSGPRRRSPA